MLNFDMKSTNFDKTIILLIERKIMQKIADELTIEQQLLLLETELMILENDKLKKHKNKESSISFELQHTRGVLIHWTVHHVKTFLDDPQAWLSNWRGPLMCLVLKEGKCARYPSKPMIQHAEDAIGGKDHAMPEKYQKLWGKWVKVWSD